MWHNPKIIRNASYFLCPYITCYGNNHCSSEVNDSSRSYYTGRNRCARQMAAPQLISKWQKMMCGWNKWQENSGLLKVRSNLAFTNVCWKCIVKQRWKCDTFSERDGRWKKLKQVEQHFMTNRVVVTLALQWCSGTAALHDKLCSGHTCTTVVQGNNSTSPQTV